LPERVGSGQKIAPDARGLVEPPFLILYRIIPDGGQIVRVLHGARNIDRTLFIEGIE
jgi:plasmid stabilization system protein ParE